MIILQVSYYFLYLRAFLKCGVILLFGLRHYLRRIPAFSKCHAQRNRVLGLEKRTVFQWQILVGLTNSFLSSVSDQKLPWAHENFPQPVALMIRYVDISVISRRRDFVRKMRSSVSSSPLDSESDSVNSRRRDSDRKRYMYLFLWLPSGLFLDGFKSLWWLPCARKIVQTEHSLLITLPSLTFAIFPFITKLCKTLQYDITDPSSVVERM